MLHPFLILLFYYWNCHILDNLMDQSSPFKITRQFSHFFLDIWTISSCLDQIMFRILMHTSNYIVDKYVYTLMFGLYQPAVIPHKSMAVWILILENSLPGNGGMICVFLVNYMSALENIELNFINTYLCGAITLKIWHLSLSDIARKKSCTLTRK